MSRSPRGPGSFAPVIPEKLASQELSASVGAPGPHVFAVRFSVARLATPLRPSHPALNVRDDRDTPLLVRRDARRTVLIWGFEQYRAPAAQWHDGQISHDAHARSARRADQWECHAASSAETS